MKGILFRYIPYDYLRGLIDINILLRQEKINYCKKLNKIVNDMLIYYIFEYITLSLRKN
jgi:hypothetical protein